MPLRERINTAPLSGTSRTAGNSLSETLSGSRTITLAELEDYKYFNFNPNSSARTVTLPAESGSKGAEILIKNTGTVAAIITINEDGATAVMSISIDESAFLWCDGTTWHGGALPEIVGAVAASEITLAEGNLLVGNASGVAEALNAKGDTKILIGNATTITSATVSGDVTIGNTGVTAIGAGKVTNAMVAPAALDGTVAKVVANANVIGGVPVIHRVTIASATADTTVVLTHKTRILEVYAVKTTTAGGGSETIIVKNVATAITDTMDLNKADKTVTRALTIDDAQWDVAAGANLVISAVAGTNCACEVVITGIRVT